MVVVVDGSGMSSYKCCFLRLVLLCHEEGGGGGGCATPALPNNNSSSSSSVGEGPQAFVCGAKMTTKCLQSINTPRMPCTFGEGWRGVRKMSGATASTTQQGDYGT